jgi:prepilin-type N-terminal cleavage/methylation domain-containing protein
MHRRRGFTLVELLVVIAILAVLLAILLPTLQGVRHLARTAACMSNHKQIGLGLLAYAADYDGWWPVRGDDTYPAVVWGETGGGWDMHATIERYVPPSDVYVCPQSAAYRGRDSFETFWPLQSQNTFKWPDYAVWAGFRSSNYTFFDVQGNTVSQEAAISMGIWDDRFIAPTMTCRLDIFTPQHPALEPNEYRLAAAHTPSQLFTQMPDEAAIQQQELNALWPDGSAATYTEGFFAGNRQNGTGTIRHWVSR